MTPTPTAPPRALRFAAGLFAALASLAACAGDPPALPDAPDPGAATGDEDTTYDHFDTRIDIWGLLERLAAEGPPKYTARVHSCPKMRFQTVAAVLASRGVDMNDGASEAADLYRTGAATLGAPNFAARQRENLSLTTAGSSKLFDVFAAAAPDLIANLGAAEACTIGGQPVALFSENGACVADGISCLIGVPATAAHLELCNETVARASTPELGKQMAVALLAAAAHTCE